MTTDATARPAPAPSRGRRVATWLHARPRLQLRLLLAAPLFWMVVVYIGSLAILLLNAFWTTDAFTGKVNPFDWSLSAFARDVQDSVLVRSPALAALLSTTFDDQWTRAAVAR